MPSLKTGFRSETSILCIPLFDFDGQIPFLDGILQHPFLLHASQSRSNLENLILQISLFDSLIRPVLRNTSAPQD
jgi:hypothetical protein